MLGMIVIHIQSKAKKHIGVSKQEERRNQVIQKKKGRGQRKYGTAEESEQKGKGNKGRCICFCVFQVGAAYEPYTTVLYK